MIDLAHGPNSRRLQTSASALSGIKLSIAETARLARLAAHYTAGLISRTPLAFGHNDTNATKPSPAGTTTTHGSCPEPGNQPQPKGGDAIQPDAPVSRQQGKPSLAEFAALGVARVSFGPALQRHLYNKFGSALLSAVASDENPFAL
jgi:hypothetical protein